MANGVTGAEPLPTWARALVSASALPIVVASHVLTSAALAVPAAPGPAPLVGIQTLLGASVLVELASFVRRSSRAARLAGPDAHARRLRTTVYLAFGIAAVQAWQLAKAHASLGAPFGAPVLCATLLGGFALQLLAARTLGRHGLVNGVLALLTAQAAVDVGREAMTAPPRTDAVLAWRGPALVVASAALTIAAVLLVARRPRTSPPASMSSASARAPYREAEPPESTTIDAPAAPAGVVAVLAAAPLGNLLLAYAPDLAGVVAIDAVLHVSLGAALAYGIGKLLMAHAPIAALWSRATGHVLLPDGALEVARASRAAVARGVVFAAALGALASAAPVRLWHVAIGTAVVVDAVRRARRGADGWVAAWPEPRATAVGPALEALRLADIRAHAADRLATSLHPWLGPVAPTTLMVPGPDVERARDLLARVLTEDAPAAPPVRAGDDVARIQPSDGDGALLRRVVLGLGVVTASALGLVALAPREPESASASPSSLEVRYVDDRAAQGRLRDVALPAGATLFEETAAGGLVPYVRIVPVQGETLPQAKNRATKWATSVAPPGTEILLGPFEEDLEDGRGMQQIGWRTWVVKPDVIVHGADVVHASAHVDEVQGHAIVAIELGDAGADAFARATRSWARRRIAMVVDGVVVSAPVVQSEISGGRLQLTMGVGDPERRLHEARRLAASLRRRP